MQTPTESPSLVKQGVNVVDERGLMLEEVNFKWLMAGMGWWVDMSRFRTDPVYAGHYLNLAKATESVELKKCATLLQQQMALDWQ